MPKLDWFLRSLCISFSSTFVQLHSRLHFWCKKARLADFTGLSAAGSTVTLGCFRSTCSAPRALSCSSLPGHGLGHKLKLSPTQETGMHGFSLMYNIVISYFALFLHDDCIFCLCKRAQLSYTVQNAEVATHKKVSRNWIVFLEPATHGNSAKIWCWAIFVATAKFG